MQPKHVKEAYRLLNKSIIRVEQPDVHLDEEEDVGEAEEELMSEEQQRAMEVDADAAAAAAGEQPTVNGNGEDGERWGHLSRLSGVMTRNSHGPFLFRCVCQK